MQAALVASGFATLNLDYASRRKPLEMLADDMHSTVAGFGTGVDGSLHFVCHSMGGLLARVYLARYRPQRLGRVVMLGTPNGGSEIADRLKNFTAYRAFFGPAGQQLGTLRDAAVECDASTRRLPHRHHCRKPFDLSDIFGRLAETT
jgi:pimeloyl-ACP methyl ester carboxylesterase